MPMQKPFQHEHQKHYKAEYLHNPPNNGVDQSTQPGSITHYTYKFHHVPTIKKIQF